MSVSSRLFQYLACPQDGKALTESGAYLLCPKGHRYPVVDGVPVLLVEGAQQTLWVAEASLKEAEHYAQEGCQDHYFLSTLGISDEERTSLRQQLANGTGPIDPVISFFVGATNGNAYKHLIGKLSDYPIPELRLPAGNGRVLLDIGCNWGRWCVAAARKGYLPIGIDPSLGAVMAGKRLAKQLGLNAQFVVGDARFLPFRESCLDAVFSYSVLQHLSKEDVISAIREIGRILKPGALSFVQMPTVLGLSCLYHQARRRFRKPRGFEVRYWTVGDLRRLFAGQVGESSLSVDCFFGIGLQPSDLRLMPWSHRVAIRASELLRRASETIRGLSYVADSVYVRSVKADTGLATPNA